MATQHALRSKWRNELLPNIVDHLACETPDALYAEYPVSPQSYDAGYRKITYGDLANAVNGAARWLTNTLGSSTTHEVLTYIGPNDLRYIVLVLAAVKAGYVLFLTSPRNSVAAHVKLFEKLSCTKLLSPEAKPAAVNAVLEKHTIQHVAVPSIEHLLNNIHVHYVYDKTFEKARSEPFMILHTSGSTGFPKPLIYSNETAARNMSMLARNPPPGIQSMDRLVQGKRVLNCFPPFHGACLVSHLFAAIPFGTVMIAPLAEAITTAQGLVDALHKTPADLAFLVPSMVLELSQDERLLDYCSKNLERCLYAGGDLPQEVGNKVASKLPLVCQYGASEIGLTPQLLPETMGPYDWKYVYFHPCLGITFKEIADGNYELCVDHEPLKQAEQPTFTLFPDITEYRSRDLFRPHPKLPSLWSWCARADDIIVFLNGEKTNPISMEQHIVARNAEVLTAIVIGAQRFQAALLLEPAPSTALQSTAAEAAFIERIWPSVQEANALTPAHARIEKALILPMSGDKPVIRAGKGTIQRGATLQQYSSAIDALYANADMGIGAAGECSEVQEISELSPIVHKIVANALDTGGLGDDDNLFTSGLDSLQALSITRKLRQTFGISDVAVATIYSSPSVARLSETVHRMQLSRKETQQQTQDSRIKGIESVLEEFSGQLRHIPQPSQDGARPEKHTVVLTGSTGTLGTNILSSLLEVQAVDHVFCLNRRNDGQEAYLRSNNASGSSAKQIDARVTFLKADLDLPNLNLPSATHYLIRKCATLIIHNAWPVNFNYALETFRPQFAGLINLFSLCASGACRPRLFFVSSISSVMGYHTPTKVTPEEIVRCTDAPAGNGYAESKFISELLCDEACRYLHIPVSVARVGQVAGPVRRPGVWNPAEWLPSLITSSSTIGALPDSLGSALSRVDWIPVDLLAETLVELSLHAPGPGSGSSTAAPAARGPHRGAEVLHIRNPQPTSWSELLPGVVATLETLASKPIGVLPAGSWVERVRDSWESASESEERKDLAKVLARIPAIRLLDFFADRLTDENSANVLSLDGTLARSAVLQRVDGVSNNWIEKWAAEWLAAAT